MKRMLVILLAITLLCTIPLGLMATVLAEEVSIEIADYIDNDIVSADETDADADAIVADEETVYQYGDHGDAVTRIQQRLANLGYYKGKVSGNYLEGTRAAIKRFQKDYAVEQTGNVDSETNTLLMNAEFRVIKDGTDGDDVTRLQDQLSALGYFTAKSTGKYRSVTKQAVVAFQKAHDIKATGIADLNTQRLLFSEDALMKGAKPTATPQPDFDMGDINDIVMVGDGESTDDTLENTKYKSKLNRGAKGDEVKKVQLRLTELGFFDGPVTGNYMTQTMTAVKQFQEHNGMKNNGITGQDTWDMLFNSNEVLDIHQPARPTPVPTPVPYAITVDVNNQVTLVYGRDENGGFTEPVKRMICSTGLKGSPSEVGEYTLTGRRARWAYFSKWGSHAQYWTRINSDIAFHSVIYNSVDYMALSVKSYNRLGTRASHGCIRLLVSDAKWLYENIDEGVVVTIREDLPTDEELTKSLETPPLNKKYMIPSTTPEPTAEPHYTSSAVPPQPFRKLSRGSEGEDVYWLQMKLKELGYYQGTVTGGYYSGTSAAVKAYQKANDLKANGNASVATLESLYASIMAVNTPTPLPTEVPEITPTPEPTPTPTETVAPTETIAPTETPAPSPTPASNN